MALFNPSSDQVRQFFFDTWAKFREQQPLTDLEKIGVQVMQMERTMRPAASSAVAAAVWSQAPPIAAR